MARDVAVPVIEDRPKSLPRSVFRRVVGFPVTLAFAVGVAVVIRALLFQMFYIPSASMVPTLTAGDRVVVNRLSYRFHDPDVGDVVVFRDPYQLDCDGRGCGEPFVKRTWLWFAELVGLPRPEDEDFIKRIVGLPGQTIAMKAGAVYVCTGCNDPRTDESNKLPMSEEIRFETLTKKDPKTLKDVKERVQTEGPVNDFDVQEPTVIAPDHYYVLGDNRSGSQDSRVFKTIPRDRVVGRAALVLWPPNRFDSSL